MASQNPLNVYRGEDSIRDYHDPDKAPLLPLVELPYRINPYHGQGVRIYAKMMNDLPAHNVKALPALNLLREHMRPDTRTIVEYSSGSTVISLAILSRVLYGMTDTWAYVSNKTHLTKLRLLQFFGLKVKLFGGPSTPDPDDNRGGIRAAEMAQSHDDKILNPNQYVSDANWRAHILWTGPQILKQLPEVNIFCAALGTTGTMSGTGTYLKQNKPSIYCLGVCIAPGNEVPGPRMCSMIQKIDFPWRKAIDCMEEITALDSFTTSIDLCREGIICGPSSGLGYKGLINYLGKRINMHALDELRGPDKLVHCIFLCCDLPYQYLDEYHKILGPNYFAPMINESLLDVDRYTYDSRWELSPQQLLEQMGISIQELKLFGQPNNSAHSDSFSSMGGEIGVIDLRSASDFEACHVRGSVNVPLDSLAHSSPSPFVDANVLEQQWRELTKKFPGSEGTTTKLNVPGRGKILIICYTGETARIATSILRFQKIEAYSLKKGFQVLR
ncbi:cysteine synthase B [Lojkania enalia]|uniref:Cysteine synthase B n=1 Tax=Lojkania enalia TaxID=147567 RepID=A0A9P4N5F5_9PLEO|nr:cysteine synthase B [Didymosphaeria enalia]